MIAQILGGIGFFLLGMTLMTDGLKSVAGDSLRVALQRFTRGPVTGTITGALVTVVVQSSSATTLATIGFVSAGLLPFTNAIGLIFGANIGTTTTGWMVSLLGLKFSISSVALPFVGIGTLLHLFTKGRLQPLGFVLAGFGLMFVAIDTLQLGMGELATQIDPRALQVDGLLGRLLLVAIGIVMTILLQSSTVALVTTMAALHTGTVDFQSAAALVVGQNVGTTFTAMVAAMGAGVPAQRTALAHVLFNLITAVIAFIALPFFVSGVELLAVRAGFDDAAVSLAAFHTGFSVLGIALLLPLARPFAAMIERIIPERQSSMTAGLDVSSAAIPAVALEAARNALMNTSLRLVKDIQARCKGASPSMDEEAAAAVRAVRTFLSGLATQPSDNVLHARHVALLHVADHLDRLLEMVARPLPLLPTREHARIETILARSQDFLSDMLTWANDESPESAQRVEGINQEIADLRRAFRREILSIAATGAISAETADALLEHVAWLDSSSYHLARVVWHLGMGG